VVTSLIAVGTGIESPPLGLVNDALTCNRIA